MAGHDPLSDRQLLYGVLAVQNDFIRCDDLIAATQSAARGARPLFDVFLEQGTVDRRTHDLLEQIVERHLQLHGGDCERSLGALALTHVIRREMSRPSAGSSQTPDEGRSTEASEATRTFTPIGEKSARLRPAGTGEAVSPDGRYVVLRPHAKGGLGQVSVARDLQLEREVAYKELLEYHVEDTETRDRFELEAKITGALEHPGIVPVYSLGFHPDGRPFYVMRFIGGETMREAIARLHRRGKRRRVARHGLDALALRRLLASFIDVCHAIHYAHSRGVLHRDVKPNNVILGKFGETLVVDWGLAKPLGETTAESSASRRRPLLAGNSAITQQGSVIGTPAYMSPEQAEGRVDSLGPATDIFALGATLYCVLTNQGPYRGPDGQSVVNEAKACRYARVREINPRAPKALAAICERAMARRPEDRYATAGELAKDLERYLADEPVLAYPEPWLERTMRWGRKHRQAVRAGAAALALLAAGSAVAAVLVNEARKEAVENRLQAIERLVQARSAVDTWLTTTGEALDWDTQSLEFQLLEPKVREARLKLLEQATAQYEKFAADETDDPDLEIERGRAYQRLGRVRALAGALDAAAEEYRRAIEVFRKVGAMRPEDALSPRELAKSHTLLGAALYTAGRFDDAAAEYQIAIETIDEMPEAPREEALARDLLGAAKFNLAVARIEARRWDEAAPLLESAFSIYEALAKEETQGTEHAMKGAQLRGTLAQTYLGLGRYDAAIAQFDAANRELDGLVLADPQNADFLDRRAAMRIFAARAQRALGRVGEERASLGRALADYQALVDARPDAAGFRENLAITRGDVGRLLADAGHAEEARQQHLAAAEQFAALARQYGAVPRYREGAAAAVDALAMTLVQLGQCDAAAAHLHAAIGEFEKLVRLAPDWGAYQERLAIGHSHYAQALAGQGKGALAAEEFRIAIAALDALIADAPDYPPYRNAAAFARYYYGGLCADQGGAIEARDAFAAAAALWQGLVEENPGSAEYRYNLAMFHVACPEASLRNAQEALVHAAAALAASPENPDYHGLLAAAESRAGQADAALASLANAAKYRGAANDWDLLFAAVAHRQLDQTAKAHASLAAGKAWLASHRPGDAAIGRIAEEAERLVYSLEAAPRAFEP